MTTLVVYFIFAITVSFICSLLEAVILSVTPAYVAVAIKNGRKSGKVLASLKARIDQPLTAILTLNTISHTIGAAGVGAEVNKIYGDAYLALSSGLLTFLILVLSEIIPKILGANHWKGLAPASAYMIKGLMVITYPVVLLSNKISKVLSAKQMAQVTREEMIETAEIGVNEGTIHKKESRVIRNILMLDNIKVSEIMTPRSVLLAFDSTETVGSVLEKYKPIRFSRIPVYKKDLDQVIGMVHLYKLMDAAAQDLDNLELEKLMTPIHAVPEEISVSAALDQFIKRKEHLFLVVDQYGSTAGIVTLEDAIETLLGVEIMDETDSVEDMRQYALELWAKRKMKGRS